MTNTVISVENLTKRYDLGVIGTGTLSRDLNRYWARLHEQPDPYTLAEGCDALVIMVRHSAYGELDLPLLGSLMRTPVLLDSSHFLDQSSDHYSGFTINKLGVGN